MLKESIFTPDEIERLIGISYELPNRVLETVPEPLVTVRTSTYNHAAYIEKCINSVLMQQTNFKFEYVIGEDFSTDGTREIVFELARKYPETIRVITADQNVRQKANSRRGIRAARGKYIAVCDGDDYWTDPFKLQKQVDFLEAHPDFVLSFHDCRLINRNGTLIRESMIKQAKKRDLSQKELITGMHPPIQTCVYRREHLKSLPVNSLSVYNGDTFLMSWLGKFGKGHFHDDIAPTAYRLHETGIWTGSNALKKNGHLINTYTELLKIHYPAYHDLFQQRINNLLIKRIRLVKGRKQRMTQYFQTITNIKANRHLLKNLVKIHFNLLFPQAARKKWR